MNLNQDPPINTDEHTLIIYSIISAILSIIFGLCIRKFDLHGKYTWILIIIVGILPALMLICALYVTIHPFMFMLVIILIISFGVASTFITVDFISTQSGKYGTEYVMVGWFVTILNYILSHIIPGCRNDPGLMIAASILCLIMYDLFIIPFLVGRMDNYNVAKDKLFYDVMLWLTRTIIIVGIIYSSIHALPDEDL